MATNRESRRAQRSADEWRQLLLRFAGRDLPVEDFCDRIHGLQLANFLAT